MGEPEIGRREPVIVAVVEGETPWWCRCGLSYTQPFCDGSHKVIDLKPLDRHAFREAQILHLRADEEAALLRQRPFEAMICEVCGLGPARAAVGAAAVVAGSAGPKWVPVFGKDHVPRIR